MRQLLEAVSDYCKQFFAATLGSMLGAVGLVLLCALITSSLRINVSSAAYQKLLLSHPFPLQIFMGVGLGFALGHRMKGNRFAVWLWILPALGLAFDFLTWHPTSVVAGGSAAEHFFTLQMGLAAALASTHAGCGRPVHTYSRVVYLPCLRRWIVTAHCALQETGPCF